MSAQKVFRHHHQMPAPAPAVATWHQLCRDWIILNSDPITGATLRQWAGREPLLAGYESLGEIVDQIDTATPADTDALLAALVGLALEGNTLAGRVVLQAMLPALYRLSRRCLMPHDIDSAAERAQYTVTMFWDVLRTTKPLSQNVARNLMMNTLNRLTKHLRTPGDMWEKQNVTTGIYPDDGPEPAQTTRELDGQSDLWDVLQWAIKTQALTTDDAQLLATVYLTAPRRADWTKAAQGAGVSVKTCQKRVERARDRLITAVRADLSPTPLTAAS